MKKTIYLTIVLLIFWVAGFWAFNRPTNASGFSVGQPIDSLNGVYVYYNGSVDHVMGRTTTADGYNLGLKYQCVEFVKRYYYEHFHYKMPDSYGHAKDFFDKTVADGRKSKKRNLIQYSNPSKTKPKVNDLLIFEGTTYNQYGHVAIVSGVTEKEIEIIQQNPGPNGKSRVNFAIEKKDDKWVIINSSVLGWLRKE